MKLKVVSLIEIYFVGKYKTVITINGEIKETKEHKDEPEEYKNVKMYSGNPWNEPSKAEVKSLEFKNVGKEIHSFISCFENL